jgi:ribosomal protein S27E
MDELENEEEKQYWLQKLTVKDLNEEIWRREKLHKRIFTNCMDCRKETNQWDEEEIENATCPSCSANLIEQNKKWMKEDKKKKIECYKCGKANLLGYRKNYLEIYCIDCVDDYWKWREKHFWFCADDCPQ